MRRWGLLLLLIALGPVCARSQSAASRTLAHIRSAGVLQCGIIREDAEYSLEDDHGSRRSFDDDLCKAFAIAVLGDRAAVNTTTFLDSASAVKALRAGKLDVVPSVSADFSHSTAANIRLTRPVFYDGVGFLVPARLQVQRADQLAGKKLCFLSETAVESDVRAWFRRRHLDLLAFPFQEQGEMEAAFATANCAAIAGDFTRLVNTRAEFGSKAGQYALLPDVIAVDPLAAATRADDPGWANVVAWVIECLVAAEEEGLSARDATNPAQGSAAAGLSERSAKLLGRTHEIGSPLGLEDDCFARVLKQLGNFGDLYDRAFGPLSSHELPRGLNRTREAGGLLIAEPLK